MLSLTDAAVVLMGGRGNARSPGSVPGTGADVGPAAVRSAVTGAARGGARVIVLVGGEPTSRPELPSFLEAVTRVGAASGIATSGRMLVYPKLRKLLLARRLAYLRVALHGSGAATHDRIAGVPGAFEQTFTGLTQMLAEGGRELRVDVAATVTSENLSELSELVARVVALPRRASLSLRFVAPLGDMPGLEWPAASAVSASVQAALEAVTASGADLIGAWEGFPPCLLDVVAPLRDETLRYGAPVYGPREVGSSIQLESEHERSHPFPCQDCVHESTCPGVPGAFLARDGEAALRPTRTVRANSFNFEVVREVDGLHVEAGGCGVLELAIEGPLGRSLVLTGGEGRGALYRSRSSDFSDEEIRRVKDDLGQIYLDRMEGAAFDDFQNSMRRVRPHAECDGCPDVPRCPGAFVVDQDPPFQREERWLRKEVSRMRGRVLDVGCGEQPYRDEVARLIAAGHIEYHGVDPDAAALERIRQSGMGGKLHHGTVEEFRFEAGYFDYVLGLRSLNHFQDMERAFRVISDLMRVAGQLVLCDAPPFGMLRTSSQVRFADDNAPVGHEHYRNWSSQQVVEFLKRFPFRVDIHRPVSTKTSNQWILKLMRVGDAEPASPGEAHP